MAAVTVPWVAPDGLAKQPAGVDLDECCLVASKLLYVLSGRKYRIASATVRPHAVNDVCACLPRWAPAMQNNWAAVFDWGRWDGCGCGLAAGLVLPGPVSSVSTVTVDGVVLDPSQYTLYSHRRLVRMADPATNAAQGWPCCQRLDLPSTEPGTWEVEYSFGEPPDEAAVAACAELALQLALARSGDSACKLPSRVVSISRQGITIPLLDPQKFLDQGRTGLYLVDVWLAAVNPKGRRRRPSIMSPETITGVTR